MMISSRPLLQQALQRNDRGGFWKRGQLKQRVSCCCSGDAAESQAMIIDGKAIAQQIRYEIAGEVAKLKAEQGMVPGLAVILVGSRKDSQTYVRSKKKACQEAGIESLSVELPENIKEEDLLEHIRNFNADENVHGILVQLPLPEPLSKKESNIIGTIDPGKDVDGIHPMNIGCLALKGREPLFVPCTPRGVILLLQRSGIEIKGKHAVVIGRSNIVGMPLTFLLQNEGATVTVVHRDTPNPAEVSRRADIVVVAVGIAGYVKKDWLKPGAVVIDVGINSVEDPTAERGYRLVGDASFEEACSVASAITPVPGGVGPMTIAVLLQNTLDSAKRAAKKDTTED